MPTLQIFTTLLSSELLQLIEPLIKMIQLRKMWKLSNLTVNRNRRRGQFALRSLFGQVHPKFIPCAMNAERTLYILTIARIIFYLRHLIRRC